jgi:DNA helicase-2/ATP-dependent DNA helicase PcrA
MIHTYRDYFGLPNSFTIYDESDAEEAIHRCATKLGFYAKGKRRPRKDMLRKILSMALNREMSIDDVLIKYYPGFEQYAKEIKDLRAKYIEYKLASQCLDYDDLLLYMKLVLEKDQIRTQLSEKYQYIMVDEYQDTNAMQGDITYYLGERHRNVLVVGDDAQSIYGFRGSSHKNIMRFPERFPGCKIITLEDNYRSTQAILDVGNAVLDSMRNKYVAVTRAKERPFILAHHEGYNNGIHTFNRLSRFIDSANVRACLDLKYATPSGSYAKTVTGPVEGYNKHELLTKLLGSVK